VINPAQIQQKAEQKYAAFLASIVKEETFLPIEFSPGAIPKEYLELLESVSQLIEKSKPRIGYGYIVDLETRKTQKNGVQSLPVKVHFDTEKDYLRFLRKEKEFSRFKSNIALIQTTVPQLYDWMSSNVLKIIENSDHWDELLKVCLYFQDNPTPNLYIRELPIQVHTKFIEQNQKIIRSLLEAILPADKLISIDGEKDCVFEKRFSLKYREPLIRLRFLDYSLRNQYGFFATDISIPISEFRQLNLGIHRCFMTENLMSFLTLPPLKNSFAIFGSGYAVQSLKATPWLSLCPIFYWGDLDVDGFRILSQLRSYFPQAISVMMDMGTFKSFEEFSVANENLRSEKTVNLTPEELNVYEYLTLHKKRLEQEHISQSYAKTILYALA
jgi:hypothetical protein